ncbi:MAG: BspA family leucine-rich repeat surface protein, partial [Enterococcus sp.]|nr:BspA family leucine-rich repeat surface protein [Enterococcus sp.]
KSDPKYSSKYVSGSLDCKSILYLLETKKTTSSITVKAGSNLVDKVKDLIIEANIPCVINGATTDVTLISDLVFKPGTTYLELVNTLLRAGDFNEATVDSFGNVVLSRYVKVADRPTVYTFESGVKSIFQPEVSGTTTKEVVNVCVLTYETEDERLVATAKNTDSESEFSVANAGQEYCESSTENNLKSEDQKGRLAELKQKCIETLSSKYKYSNQYSFTAAYYPVSPDQAIELKYLSANLSIKGVIHTMKIDLTLGASTDFTVSILIDKTIKMDTNAVVEWQRNDYEPTAYTVKKKDGVDPYNPVYSGNYAIWWNDIQIFPERQYTLEKNNKETIQTFTGIDNTNYSEMDSCAFYDVADRDMGRNTLDIIRFLQFTSTKRWKPKSLKHWFSYDYNITDKAKRVSDEKATSPDWYTYGSGNFLGCDWSIDDQRFDQNPTKFRDVIDMSECTDLSHVWHNMYGTWPERGSREKFNQVCKSLYYWQYPGKSNTASVTTLAFIFCRDIHVSWQSGGAVSPNYTTGPWYFPCVNWCVSNVTTMERMFDNGAPQLRSAYNRSNVKKSGDDGTYGLDLSRWERPASDTYGFSTTKQIINMRYAFRNCKTLDCIDMGAWKIKTRVADAYTGMFDGCTQRMLIRWPGKDKNE